MAARSASASASSSERENGNNDGLLLVRIPPPPPLPPSHDNDHGPVHQWVMKVRCLTKAGTVAGIRIQVYPNMTPDSLGRCISQAVASYNSMPPETIVGLFGDHDSVFYSLEHILQSPDSERAVFSVTRPLPKEDPKDGYPAWRAALDKFLLLAVVAAVVVFKGETILDFVAGTALDIFYFIFDMPIRELYRYGPHLVGWEGLDLPDICSRITYHGDRVFWTRNLTECEEIYRNKEEAFVRVLRPIFYAILLVATFVAIRHLVAVYAENKRDRTDRAVLETYHAFQTLVKLANRQVDRQNGGRRR